MGNSQRQEQSQTRRIPLSSALPIAHTRACVFLPTSCLVRLFPQKPNLKVIPLLADKETQRQVAQEDSDGGGTQELGTEGTEPQEIPGSPAARGV